MDFSEYKRLSEIGIDPDMDQCELMVLLLDLAGAGRGRRRCRGTDRFAAASGAPKRHTQVRAQSA
jgi:hypothetical protein